MSELEEFNDMSNQNNTRRGFLQKLGLTVGAAVVLDSEVLAEINPNKYSNETERNEFLNQYEIWVNDYISVVENEKKDSNNVENKKRIMHLSAQAEEWPAQIKEYIKHDDFKQKYFELSKQFAEVITPELEA
ncbi:twin-arginine translocation signal domain-containing protein [Marinifilum sp. N1E240]|uniref:twin-arginine translocation signal domain-containing protein n=1 Tax=Marinifilum sp. N1E240 TaxID=2608082 RepID=UPI00128B1133|nr:twin-arginine translocation signal domain-containing protein [Marinifilum sp. N1E240]MPQ47886.1 twin-arginine translocation signal domain-containing protein [Marinifilum sp. N1E240]